MNRTLKEGEAQSRSGGLAKEDGINQSEIGTRLKAFPVYVESPLPLRVSRFRDIGEDICLNENRKRCNVPEYINSRNVDALVEAGFAERHTDPDGRRSFLIFLTKKRKDKAEEFIAIVHAVNDDVLTGLSFDERSTVLTLLQKVAGVSAPWNFK